MSNETFVLMGTALGIGFFHTIFGPDHYLPFIVLSKARKWSVLKTSLITLLCGIGHVLSSVILGFIGIGFGVAIFKLEAVESFRGDIAAWLLLIFGFTYFIWGLHRAISNGPHTHLHIHNHSGMEMKNYPLSNGAKLTPWILFIIFVFGPCEPLIPILMYPAAKGDMVSVIMVTAVFGLTTILSMLAIVLTFSYGLSRVPVFLSRLERYSHAIAGFVLFLCGGAIKFLGL